MTAMSVIRRSARGLLLTPEGELLFMQRTRPGQAPYCVAIGGGLEDSDDGRLENALRREVKEEAGGTLEEREPSLIFIVTDKTDVGANYQYFFLSRLVTFDEGQRTGSEFGKSERGGYELIRVSPSVQQLKSINLLPVKFLQYVQENLDAILDLRA